MNTAMPIETLTPEEFAAKYLPILRGEDTPKANPLDSDAEIAHVLRGGSGFEGGKLRIAALYANDPSPADAAAFLRNEYGDGGHSHTFLDGTHGFVDYDFRGIKIRHWKSTEEYSLTWNAVEKHIRAMIAAGDYLTDEEQRKFAALPEKPMPIPRIGYPPVINGHHDSTSQSKEDTTMETNTTPETTTPAITQKPEPTATPDDYFVENMETGKLELHFAKSTYTALDDEAKKRIKQAFLWGRNTGCWISRCKSPNLYSARRVAESLGLTGAGKEGERLSYAEQMERKAERAERRAERYENRAEAAEKRGETLQAPINHMHGDIAFFTQPITGNSAGRAFAKRREKMWQSFEKGFEEFNKSAYWAGRASTARATAGQKELQDKAFVMRRIKERESDIRAIQRNITEAEGYLDALEKGETPKNRHGWTIDTTVEKATKSAEYWLDRLEVKLDELGFYQDCLDALGGVAFSRENIKPGYVLQIKWRDPVVVVSTGPKNFTYAHTTPHLKYADGTPMKGQAPYAEIKAVLKATEAAQEKHPYKVGEKFTCPRWNDAIGNHGGIEEVTYTVIRTTDKSVTLQTGDEKPIVRKPARSLASKQWYLSVNDMYKSTWYKPIEA